MKHVVSVSIGSSSRNHSARITLLGEEILVERIGTDGDVAKAKQLIGELKDKVDAFGLGGIDLYLEAKGRKYYFREAKNIAAMAGDTPVVDGTGLKSRVEYNAVMSVATEWGLPIAGKDVFLVCVFDRIGMGLAFEELGCRMTYGDLMFATGIPIPLYKISSVHALAPIVMPWLTQLPFSWVYPTGKSQRANRDKAKKRKLKFQQYYNRAHVLAGDFHYIYRHLPERIDGKIIVTNTVTEDDVEDIGRRGAHALVTTSPEIQGRSFGANLMEAMLIALIDKPIDEITDEDYDDMMKRLDLRPRVVVYD
ncbi:MAG: quinate 5-dehydrogenase [Bacillota bacterium]